MTPEAWAFAGLVVVNLCGVLVVWIQNRNTKAAVDKAAEYAKPTGNGFAAEVRESLQRIEGVATQARDEIREHKNAHVQASLRSVR